MKRRMRAEICIAMVMVCEDWILMVLEMFGSWMSLGIKKMDSGRSRSYQRPTSQY